MSDVRSKVVLYLLCSSTMSAQIDHLATTSDGSVLYFSADFSLKTSNHPRFEQIFRYRDQSGTFEECIDPELVGTYEDAELHLLTVGFGNPDVTADGSLVAFNQVLKCTGTGGGCVAAAVHAPLGLVKTPGFTDGTSVWNSGG